MPFTDQQIEEITQQAEKPTIPTGLVLDNGGIFIRGDYAVDFSIALACILENNETLLSKYYPYELMVMTQLKVLLNSGGREFYNDEDDTNDT